MSANKIQDILEYQNSSVPQQNTDESFCMNDFLGSVWLFLCCCCWLFATWGDGPLAAGWRVGFDGWNCCWTCVLAAGVDTGFDNAPVGALGRLFGGAPVTFRPSLRIWPIGFPGDGGGGCGAFKRPGVSPCAGWRTCAGGTCRNSPVVVACGWLWPWYWWEGCLEIASQPLPLLSFIQSYSPSSTSPVFFNAWVKRSRSRS